MLCKWFRDLSLGCVSRLLIWMKLPGLLVSLELWHVGVHSDGPNHTKSSARTSILGVVDLVGICSVA
jgi:hypothetical protein